MWDQKTGSWSISCVIFTIHIRRSWEDLGYPKISWEASELATLSQQAKEHLHNWSARVTLITGSAKGEQGDEDLYKASELIPPCLPNNCYLHKRATLDWQPNVNQPFFRLNMSTSPGRR